MLTADIAYRQAHAALLGSDVSRISRYVDALLRATRSAAGTNRELGAKMESLRNKRDTAETKVRALGRHLESGWRPALQECERARLELVASWRAFIKSIEPQELLGTPKN